MLYEPSSPGVITERYFASITRLYYIASLARCKLEKEASRPDHRLRLLVGTANLLDAMLVRLADAEREREARFNESIKNRPQPRTPRQIKCLDQIPEEKEEERKSSNSNSETEIDQEEDAMFGMPLQRTKSLQV